MPSLLRDSHIFFLENGGEVASLTRRQPFTPQEYSWYSFLLEADPQGRHVAERDPFWNSELSNFSGEKVFDLFDKKEFEISAPRYPTSLFPCGK
jgi:hypothetical protein